VDAPPIQYAKTSDGVNIAYWAIGKGPPLVVLCNPAGTNIQLEWELDIRRIAYERLAERATVIRYDCRGLGVSQRDCLDLSPEATVRDLDAVVDSLGLARFAAYGFVNSPITFVYPAKHPGRVSHLIVGLAPIRRGFLRRYAAIRVLADQDWEMFTEFYSRLIWGWDSPAASQMASWIRGTTDTPSNWTAAFDTLLAFSPDPFLADINAPTLILHPRESESQSRFARRLTGGITGAHLMGLPNWPYGTLNETAVNAILDFINAAPASPGAQIPAPRVDVSAVRTIVFTDVEASTALNVRLGDEAARAVLREHERITRETLSAHGGSEVKAMGDGFMIWFPSATRALECAIALQKAFAAPDTTVGAQRDAKANDVPPSNEVALPESPRPKENAAPLRPASEPRPDTPEPLRIRVGINAGEPIAEGDDLFGASVIAAARICAQGNGGEILVSDVVRQLVAGKGFTFGDPREAPLKGFEDPVRLYELHWQA